MKKQSKFKKLLYSQKVAPYVFVMPFIITFVVFFAYSIVSMIIMSFQKVAGPNTTFVGLEKQYLLYDRYLSFNDSDSDGSCCNA